MTPRRAGHEVARAAAGLEASRRSSGKTPDLILLNVTMPRSAGLEALRRTRQHRAPRWCR